MKINTKNIMKSKWEIQNMNTAWKYYAPYYAKYYSGMPSGKHLNSKNSRRTYNRMLKNKWRKMVDRIINNEITEALIK